MAAGVTPGIRAAWPKVAGRTRSSFSWISRDNPGIPLKPNSVGIDAAFRVFQALDLPLLLPDVTAVLGLSFNCRKQTERRLFAEHFHNPGSDLSDGSLRALQPLPGFVVSEHLPEALLLSLLAVKHLPPLVRHQARPAANRGQSLIGIVDSQVQTEFGARREHPVRLVSTLGDQIVNQNSGIALGSAEDHRLLAGQARMRH